MTQQAAEPLESDSGKFAFDKLRIRFTDAQVEDDFTRVTLIHSLHFIRAYFFAGTLLYGLFGALDYAVGGETTQTLWLIRYSVVAILLSLFASTFTPYFLRFAQPLLATAMISTGLGIIAMTSIMAPPFNSQYYAGLIMVVIYCAALIRLKYIYSLMISIGLVVCYQFVCFWINPISYKDAITNDFFLVMSSGVGLFSSYIQELYLRRAYIATKVIEAKNELTNQLLIESNKANKSKNEFLATMSHELRTPLNAIIGFSDILKKELFGPISNPQYSDYINDIHNSGAHLLTIINAILDLAKAESGKLQLNEQEADLAEIVERTVRLCQPMAANSGIALGYSGADKSVYALFDEKLLRQIVLNLVSNAIKFTLEGGKVSVVLDAKPQSDIVIVVADTGVGIQPDDIERVLRPFEQVASALTRKHDGTGLGLPYAARLATLHGGSLTLESTVNVGTTVTVRLPAKRLRRIEERSEFNTPELKEAV